MSARRGPGHPPPDPRQPTPEVPPSAKLVEIHFFLKRRRSPVGCESITTVSRTRRKAAAEGKTAGEKSNGEDEGEEDPAKEDEGKWRVKERKQVAKENKEKEGK